jgi:uncharacterized protein YcbK (DUF882 family)
MTQLLFFKISEFACRCGRPDCDAVPIDMELCLKLDGLRLELNQAIHINSGTRCPFENLRVDGTPDSQHLLGKAVDIHCPDGAYMFRILELAIKHGFKGIGVKPHTIHLDIRDDKSAWGYP